MKSFSNASKMKKACLTYIASQLSDSEISKLSEAFEKLDKDSNGILTF